MVIHGFGFYFINMRISIIHPSRGRAKQAFETAKRWIDNSVNVHFEYILSLDYDDDQLSEYKTLFGSHSNDFLLLIDDNRQSAIEAINWGAQKATGDLIIVISDDFDCPIRWDELLKKEVSGKSDFVLKTQDGIQKTLVTLPIVDRVWYERYGYIYHPDYRHMYADQELTSVAIMTGRFLQSDLIFPHLHYTVGKSQRDYINEKNDSTYAQGNEVLIQHRANNFGIDNPVCSYESIIWH